MEDTVDKNYPLRIAAVEQAKNANKEKIEEISLGISEAGKKEQSNRHNVSGKGGLKTVVPVRKGEDLLSKNTFEILNSLSDGDGMMNEDGKNQRLELHYYSEGEDVELNEGKVVRTVNYFKMLKRCAFMDNVLECPPQLGEVKLVLKHLKKFIEVKFIEQNKRQTRSAFKAQFIQSPAVNQ